MNLTWLNPGVVGGSEEYTVRLLESVGRLLPDEFGLRLYGPPALAAAHPNLAGRYPFEPMPSTAGGRLGRIAMEQSWLAAKSRNDALVHHAGGTVPAVRAAPGILTIHDLQPLEMPQNFSVVKRRWLATALPASVRAAELVLCPSEFTAGRVHALLDVPTDKLRVVPHGHRLPASASGQVVEQVKALRADYGRYLLYPAIAYAHKRHRDLLHLLSSLGPDYGDLSLVFTGRPGPETDELLFEASALGLENRIRVLGRVPAHQLDLFYRGAEALVFPSAYEGFGNPVIEAMGLACPVVASDGGALPEVVGDAGLVYPVGDVEAMAKAVRRVLDEPGLADDLRRAGRVRASAFEVDIAAQTLADVYREGCGL